MAGQPKLVMTMLGMAEVSPWPAIIGEPSPLTDLVVRRLSTPDHPIQALELTTNPINGAKCVRSRGIQTPQDPPVPAPIPASTRTNMDDLQPRPTLEHSVRTPQALLSAPMNRTSARAGGPKSKLIGPLRLCKPMSRPWQPDLGIVPCGLPLW
jgi:hypothetical protein